MAYQIEVEKTYKSILTIMEGSEKDALRKAVQVRLSGRGCGLHVECRIPLLRLRRAGRRLSEGTEG